MNANQKTRILERIGALVKKEAIRRCPTDQGFMRQSIDFRIEGDSVIIFSRDPNSVYMEYGTGRFHIDNEGNPSPRPGYDIFPKKAKALRFEAGRKDRLANGVSADKASIIYAKKVHIEGVPPHPFMRPAVHQSMEEIERIIREELAR